MKWLIRPKRHDDESIRGYLCRVAEANGVASASLFRAVTSSGEVITGFGSTRLEPATYDGMDPRYTLVEFQRICPACLKEGAYLRAAWDHALLCNCLKHHLELIDVCPVCGFILRRGPGRVARCSCGHPLGQAYAKAVLPTFLEYLLANRLRLPNVVNPDGVPYFISRLSACELVKLIVLLGTYDPIEGHKKPRKVAVKTGATNARRIMSRASILLSSWPVNFHQILTTTYLRHPANSTFAAVFGRFYSSIYRDLQGKTFDFVREAFESWVADKWSGHLTERHQRISKAARSKKRVVPVTRLSRDLGVSASRLQALVLAGELRGSVRPLPSGKKSTMIELDHVSHARKLTNHYTLGAASKVLGLPEVRLRALLDAGVVAGRRPVPGGKWRIHVGELDRLFELMKALPILKETDHEAFLSLDKVFRFYWTESDSFVELFGAILSGDLTCVRRARIRELGAAAILIPREIFFRWQLERTPGISVQELAKRLQVKQEVAYHLVRSHIIQVNNRGRLGDFVAEDEIARFRERYVWARELAQNANTSPKKMVSVLRSTGLQAVVGPDVDGCRQYLYSRRDVTQASVL